MLVGGSLTCRFGAKAAVDNGPFSIAPGGLSASSAVPRGKSTLLDGSIASRPTEGRILYQGVDIRPCTAGELRHGAPFA